MVPSDPVPSADLAAVDAGLLGAAENAEPAAPPNAQPLALPAPACSVGPQAVALVGAHRVGAFDVSVSGNSSLSVRHDAEGQRVLFATAQGSPLELGRASLEVEDRQGSFSAHETVTQSCRDARLDAAYGGPSGLELRGHFADADAVCGTIGFSVSFCEVAPGQLRFEVRSTDQTFNLVTLRVLSEANERIYGMGEQAPRDTLNLKGRAIEVIAQEGGVGRGHVPITPAVNLASPGSGGNEGSAYYAAPHYLTNLNRSLFLENTEYAVFDFRSADVSALRSFSPVMVGRVLQGSSPLQLIERFTAYAGRMPALPDWVNQGAIVALAKTPEDSLKIVDALRARGVEIAGVWNQTWSGISKTFIGEQVLWNWIQNPNSRPGWDGYTAALQTRGIRTLCYVNSMFRDVPPEAGSLRRNLFQEGLAGNYFVHRTDGSVYLLPITAFDVGLLDLTNADARRWMKNIIREEMMDNAHCSGWMADFAEALPFDAVLASGETAQSYHNDYPVQWAKLNREAIEEAGRLGDVMFFNRSGHTRTPSYSTLLWQGDQLTTWDKYDGLVNALRELIGGGLSGIALNHSDTGGYTSLSRYGLGYSREPEQLKRWTEMNAFTAVLRTHEGNQPAENAQVYSDASAMDHFARFTKVYKALAFYRRALSTEATQRGLPLVRHLMLHYPEDARAHQVDNEFLLGSEILVAPIENKCWTAPFCPYDKNVYLPKGRWVHLWTGKVYGDATRGKDVTVKAPIGEPAVFYREGSSVGRTFVANLQKAGISAK